MPRTPAPSVHDAVVEPLDRRRWAALAVLCLSLLVIVVDNTIVNVALPSLVGELRADLTSLQWVVDAYTLTFAALLLLAGTLGDRFGRRRILLGGLAIFGIASAAAAFASGIGTLVAARAVMGCGAAFIMPATLSLLSSIFTDTRERTLAIGIWAATTGVGVALGPVVGGVLLDHFWWGSVFIVNVPIALGAIVLAGFLVPESRSPVAHRIDWVGAALSGVGLLTLVWAIIEVPSQGWSSVPVLGAIVVAGLLLTGFARWERRAPEPLLDLALFRDPRFATASGTIMVLFFALFGFLFVATQYLQFVLGFSPSAAGIRMLPYALAMIVAAPLSSKLVERFGTRPVVGTGMAVFTLGLAVVATMHSDSGFGHIAVAMVAMGVGMGLAAAPATDAIMAVLPPERAGIGSAVNDTTRELGGALGVAVVGSIVSSLYRGSLEAALPASTPAPIADAARESVGAAVHLPSPVGDAIAAAARDAFTHAMSRASLVLAVVAGLGVLAAWRFLPDHDPAPTPSSIDEASTHPTLEVTR